jgi:hypothetical protein
VRLPGLDDDHVRRPCLVSDAIDGHLDGAGEHLDLLLVHVVEVAHHSAAAADLDVQDGPLPAGLAGRLDQRGPLARSAGSRSCARS